MLLIETSVPPHFSIDTKDKMEAKNVTKIKLQVWDFQIKDLIFQNLYIEHKSDP